MTARPSRSSNRRRTGRRACFEDAKQIVKNKPDIIEERQISCILPIGYRECNENEKKTWIMRYAVAEKVS